MTPLSSTIIRDVGWMAEFDIEFDKYSEHAMQLMSSLTGNGSPLHGSPVYTVKYELWDAVQKDIMSGDAR